MAETVKETQAPEPPPALPEIPKQTELHAGSGSDGDGDKSEHQTISHADTDALLKAEHAKATAEEQPNNTDDAVDTAARIGELRNEGHGPQRHLDVNDDQLTARMGDPIVDPQTGDAVLKGNGHVRATDHIDPMTGTTVDGVTGATHRCGDYATRFDSAEDYAHADQYMRQHIGDTGPTVAKVPIEDVLGPDGHERLTGVYHDPENPGEFKDVDFTGGSIVAVYNRDADGKLSLYTMYADPAPFNPSEPGRTET